MALGVRERVQKREDEMTESQKALVHVSFVVPDGLSAELKLMSVVEQAFERGKEALHDATTREERKRVAEWVYRKYANGKG